MSLSKHILYIHPVEITSKKANLIQVISMCNAFTKNGYRIDLALLCGDLQIDNPNDYIISKYGIQPSFNIIIYNKLRFSRIGKYFRNNQLHTLIHSNEASIVFVRVPSLVNEALKYGKAVIFESHSNLLHNRIKIIDWYLKRRLLRNTSASKFSLFICISNELSKYWLASGVSKSKLLTLHDGVDIEAFKNNINKKESRLLLGLPTLKKIVVYTGSLYPDREIENIIRLAQRFPEVHFCIVGGPEKNKDYYLNLSTKLRISNISFSGHRPHSTISMYLAAADILLAVWSRKVPTIGYCSPLKIFEYMASGKTIVAHGFPTIHEVLTHNKTAFLADPDNFDDLSLKLMDALSNGRNVGPAAQNLVISEFTWDKRVKAIIHRLRLYESGY